MKHKKLTKEGKLIPQINSPEFPGLVLRELSVIFIVIQICVYFISCVNIDREKKFLFRDKQDIRRESMEIDKEILC